MTDRDVRKKIYAIRHLDSFPLRFGSYVALVVKDGVKPAQLDRLLKEILYPSLSVEELDSGFKRAHKRSLGMVVE